MARITAENLKKSQTARGTLVTLQDTVARVSQKGSNRVSRLVAKLRQRQLELAMGGAVRDSARYADRARRVRGMFSV